LNEYWYEDNFVIGEGNNILHQIIKCNFGGPNNEHIGRTPVYSEWLK